MNISLTGCSFIEGIFFNIKDAIKPNAIPIKIDINAKYINCKIINIVSDAVIPSLPLA